MYWYYYQKFYPATQASAAHSELCRRVFGEDLCQEGRTDMVSLKDMLEIIDLKQGEHLLDLGCGAGSSLSISQTGGAFQSPVFTTPVRPSPKQINEPPTSDLN